MMISHGSSGVLFEVSRLCSLLLRFDCPPTLGAAAIWWRLLVTWYTPVSGRLVAESAERHYRFWHVNNWIEVKEYACVTYCERLVFSLKENIPCIHMGIARQTFCSSMIILFCGE
ncbi:hypothetical protein J6590_097480 [Homalodisca vitripennis]|nr:hypothetical protein J6590_097480 [Homalodisca vitripennis]